LIFAPFNFAVLFGSRNKGHADIKGFTVYTKLTFKITSWNHITENIQNTRIISL